MKAVIKCTIRFDSKTQLERHRRAAKRLKWSLNRFYLEAADNLTAATNTLETTQKVSEQLINQSEQLTLNQ